MKVLHFHHHLVMIQLFLLCVMQCLSSPFEHFPLLVINYRQRLHIIQRLLNFKEKKWNLIFFLISFNFDFDFIIFYTVDKLSGKHTVPITIPHSVRLRSKVVCFFFLSFFLLSFLPSFVCCLVSLFVVHRSVQRH